MTKKIISMAILSVLFVGLAQSNDGLAVYRGLDGEITAQSRSNLNTLIDIAKQQGTVTVWVDFAIEFQADPALRTPEVVAIEEAQRDDYIEEHIIPLVHQGKAIRIVLDPVPMAPGCMLEIDQSGLKKLAADAQIKYIGYFEIVK